MDSPWLRSRRRGVVLAASLLFFAGQGAAAQDRWRDQSPPDNSYPQRPPQVPLPPADSGADLRRNLTAVGSNPANISALIESGRAALAMGDAQAALTFFSRADELAPRDPRIKAGMGTAMALLGQARPALTLFAEAVSLGAQEVEIASDRGLAHDLNGDPRAAQRDYALVLRRRDHPETRRRLALSLAISGQREPALRLLEPQTRRNDRAAWRTQVFVLALTGDRAGASRLAANVLPGAGGTIEHVFSRLPSLNPAQRAMAVHLGVFPSDGRPQYAANTDISPDPGALALAGGPATPRPAPVAAAPARDARAGSRRRGARSPIERAAVRTPRTATGQGTQTAEVRPRQRSTSYTSVLTARVPTPQPQRRPSPPAATRASPPPAASAPPARRFQPPPEPVEDAPHADAGSGGRTPSGIDSIELPPAEPAPLPPAISSPPAAGAPVDPAILAGVRPGDIVAAPGFSLTPSATADAAPSTTISEPAPAAVTPTITPSSQPAFLPPASERRNSALSDIAMVVNALPGDPQGGTTAAAPARRPDPAPARDPAPSRHWVQLASNVERASMASEFRRLRGRAPGLLNGMQAWMTPATQTSRLLIGPFGSARDAQSFVNQLSAQGLSTFAWTSSAGQVIERLPGGR